ncbi:dehypoxanthine futalosine cyclase, partial [Streptomyces sp. NPDC001480]
MPRPTPSPFQSVLDRAAAGGRITPEEALALYRDAPLHALGA